MSSGLNARRCADLAQIVGGTPAFMGGVCLVQLLRADLSPTILGARTRSPLVLPVFFSIESPGDGGMALNLGEAVLRQDEVNTVMLVLRESGIIVTALHNHWLFEEPRLMYMHWEARMDPARFLRASQAALRAAGVRTMPLSGDDGMAMMDGHHGDHHQKEEHHGDGHMMAGHHGGDWHKMDDGSGSSGHEDQSGSGGHQQKKHDGGGQKSHTLRWHCNCPTCSKWRRTSTHKTWE